MYNDLVFIGVFLSIVAVGASVSTIFQKGKIISPFLIFILVFFAEGLYLHEVKNEMRTIAESERVIISILTSDEDVVIKKNFPTGGKSSLSSDIENAKKHQFLKERDETLLKLALLHDESLERLKKKTNGMFAQILVFDKEALSKEPIFENELERSKARKNLVRTFHKRFKDQVAN